MLNWYIYQIMISTLEMHLLGSCTFRIDGEPMRLATRAAEGIAVYVAHQPHPVPREQLMLLFFASSTPKQAAANMRRELSAIKKMLGDYFTIDRTSIAAIHHLIELDSSHFSKQHTSLEGRVVSYQGAFLAGFFVRDAPEFDQWAQRERERLRLLAINRFVSLLRQQQADGSWQAALQTAARLTGIEPLLEEAQQAQMLLLARTGQRASALKHYQQLVTLFAQELGVMVSAETTQLHNRILRSSTPPAHNLRTPSNQFVGRSKEIAAVLRLIAAPEQRAITLLGMGGIGKSSLAQHLGRELITHMPGSFLDGIYFVELASVTSAPALLRQLINTLGVSIGGQTSLLEQLVNWLREREMLLMLDNFEQLAHDRDVGDMLTKVLANAPMVTLLITSRQRIGLYDETVYELAGLPVPEASASNLEQAASVTLFLNHARRQRHGFVANSAEFATIATICRLLAGVPLAIELAASWVRYLQPQEINDHVQQSFDFLTTESRHIPERQRSLRAVFEHSWQLLPEPTRALFARLSIFPTTFTSQAAASIANATIPQLASLIDSSLLQQRDDGRYEVHALLREFSHDMLPAIEKTRLRREHAAYYASFIAARSSSHRPTYARTFPDLVSDDDNLMLAWDNIIDGLLNENDARPTQWIAEMRHALSGYLFKRNQFYMAQERFAGAQRRFEEAGWHLRPFASAQRLLHAQLASTALISRWILGDVVGIIDSAEMLLPVLRHNDAAKDVINVLNMITQLHIQQGNHDPVPALLHGLKNACEAVDEPAFQSTYYMSHSFYEDRQDNDEASLSLALSALKLVEPLEDTRYQSRILESCARRMFKLGRSDEAFVTMRRAADLALEDGAELEWAHAQKTLGTFHEMSGDADAALAHYENSLAIAQAHNSQLDEVRIELLKLRILLQQARDGAAELEPALGKKLQDAVRLAHAMGQPQEVLEGVLLFARYLHLGGDDAVATGLAAFVLHEGADGAQALVDEFVAGGRISAETISATKAGVAKMTFDDITLIILKSR